eukprot:3716194-Ditylum_brightwellii.AAC.1
MKPFVRAILPKMGFNHNTVREIVYNVYKYGGFQLAHLYLEQGYLAMKHLLGHIWEQASMSNQIMIALRYTKIVTGSSLLFLFDVEADRSYVPAS